MRHVPLPPEQRRDGDGDRQAPHERDHDARALGRADAPVLERAADGQVAVPADGDQVQDGRRAAEHVQGAPEHAHLAAEHPDSQQFLHGREREHEPAEEQVGHGEGDDEIVGGGAEVMILEHRHDDEDVPHDRHQNDKGQHHTKARKTGEVPGARGGERSGRGRGGGRRGGRRGG